MADDKVKSARLELQTAVADFAETIARIRIGGNLGIDKGLALSASEKEQLMEKKS